jgi:hypothetical protein
MVLRSARADKAKELMQQYVRGERDAEDGEFEVIEPTAAQGKNAA